MATGDALRALVCLARRAEESWLGCFRTAELLAAGVQGMARRSAVVIDHSLSVDTHATPIAPSGGDMSGGFTRWGARKEASERCRRWFDHRHTPVTVANRHRRRRRRPATDA